MLEKTKAELSQCLKSWRSYEKTLIKAGLNGPLQATAVGWKVANLQSFRKINNSLLDQSEQVHVGTVNDRFIGSYILKKPIGTDNIGIIKVLQRRGGSSDPTGLDHIDFFESDIELAKTILTQTKANWKAESNDVHAWLSIRFGNKFEFEAKLVDHLVLDAAIKEMQQHVDNFHAEQQDKL